MSYTVQTTAALVIGATYHGEANRRLWLLTRELGLINVQAQGIRNHASKLRFHTQIFSQAQIDVVQSRGGWRLIGVLPNDAATPSQEWWSLCARIGRLLRRLLQGEDIHPELFDTVAHIFGQLNTLQGIDRQMIEMVAVAKILDHLGYMDVPELQGLGFDQQAITAFVNERGMLISSINQALEVSQL